MTLDAIREQVKTIMAAVDGIGVVHGYQRWAADWAAFLNLFKTPEGKINGWMITRESTPEQLLDPAEYERVYGLKIIGIYGLNDSDGSELVFQSLVESICDAFRSDYNLNGTCETTSPDFGPMAGVSGIQVQTVENRVFGNVLCHYCELGLGVQVIETI